MDINNPYGFHGFQREKSSRLAAGMNPAEFVIDLVSIDHESQTQAMKVSQPQQVNLGRGFKFVLFYPQNWGNDPI